MEEIKGDGVGIACYHDEVGNERVEIGVERLNKFWAYRTMPISDAKELFKSALKMIQARQKETKE